MASETREIPSKLCKWHKGEPSYYNNEYDVPGCQGCGRIYHTKECKNCGQFFIDWGNRGFDDVCAGIYITTSGDAYCNYCGPDYDDEEDRYDDWDQFSHPDSLDME